MRSIKAGMIFLFCLYAVIGEGNDQKKQVEGALNYLSELIAQKYQLSTTGYQVAMVKNTRRLTPKRAQEYTAKAKELFKTETLKNLGLLQSKYINCVPESGFLSSPHEMNEGQLTSCLGRVREKNFANCDMQALEVAIHIYALGFKNISVISNKAISHNYVVLEPNNLFPKGAIVDSWTGFGFMELNTATKLKYKHSSANIEMVQSMMSWLKKNAVTSANNAWIVDIRRKYFRGVSVPLQTILKPISGKK
ncbi:MAG: type III effector [Epsilonproteobacteria bacterium]|nr:MAG: type III effector [Campylobacterota bacterium]RLA65810.1 MAG: type III effector [Campylobacterota bacterium]